MKRTLIAVACCTFAIAGGNALAQDHSTSTTSSAHESSGESLGQKTRDAAHRVGEKTRHLFHRSEDKMGKAKSDHDRKTAQEAGDDTRAMGASSMNDDSGRQRRMDEAYNDYKSGHASTTR